jgi:hypothetical protein
MILQKVSQNILGHDIAKNVMIINLNFHLLFEGRGGEFCVENSYNHPCHSLI